MKSNVFKVGALALLLSLSLGLKAQQQRVKYLDIDEKVAEYPKVEWIKGQGFAKFDKDKIYIIELWATWCKPCIAAMPHLSKLNAKFKDKITFISQNVLDDKIEKAKDFVEKNSSLFDYPVAYGGMQGSDFYLNWMKPSGTAGIPRTFVIQNNTLVWMTEPTELNEKVLQLLVDKKFSIGAAKKLGK